MKKISPLFQSDIFNSQYEGSVVLSEDNSYRYFLGRRWSSKGKTIAFICLNPSTADSYTDDQTVRRCIQFSKLLGGAQLVIGNLFAYRSTDPCKLKEVTDPIGKENDEWLAKIIATSDLVIAGWGLHGALNMRDIEILSRFKGKLSALRLTKDGYPSHPLYLPRHLTPFKL